MLMDIIRYDIFDIYEGSFVKELDPENATPEILGSYMTGLKT